MSTQPQSDRDQVTYRTYDDRSISRAAIRKVLAELDNRERRMERARRFRSWFLAALVSLVLLVAFAILLWRLATML